MFLFYEQHWALNFISDFAWWITHLGFQAILNSISGNIKILSFSVVSKRHKLQYVLLFRHQKFSRTGYNLWSMVNHKGSISHFPNAAEAYTVNIRRTFWIKKQKKFRVFSK